MKVKLLRILAPIILLSVILPTVDVGSDLYLIYEFFSGGLATCSVRKANVIIDECFENTKSNCEYYDHIQGTIYKYTCLTYTRLNCKEVAEARVIECRKCRPPTVQREQFNSITAVRMSFDDKTNPLHTVGNPQKV